MHISLTPDDKIESVVFLIFNRPQETEKVFSCIRDARPSRLFIIADGPRLDNSDDYEKCKITRKITESIDWDCQVFRNFSEQNLGCKRRIESGLTWVFEQVDQAIVLEDDCLPNPSFFAFCSELLKRYRHDERIMAISGDNFLFGQIDIPDSYYFSRYPHCWGWATWKRAWQYYDVEMSLWPEAKNRNSLKEIFHSAGGVRYWHQKFQKTYDAEINSWDYAWTLACWLQNGLCILPSTNLVSNIGFNAQGTHLIHNCSPFSNIPTTAISFPLSHPPIVLQNSQADKFSQFHQFGLLPRFKRKIQAAFSNWGK